MKRSIVVAGFLVAALAAASPAVAGLILAPGSSWEYTLDSTLGASGNPDWNTETNASNGVETDWGVANSPFGNCPAAPGCGSYTRDFDDPDTKWAADGRDGDDLWVRTTVDFTGFVLSSIAWDLGVDNGYTLYLDGVLIASHNGEGYTHRWEYGGVFPGATTGSHIVAVALEDHGALTAFDMQITGDPVPEPGTLLLLGAGLAGLGLLRRRQA